MEKQRVLYLDACCLNRPLDDQTQDGIRLEAEAVICILKRIQSGEWRGIGSEVLDYEIQQCPDPERRERVEQLAALLRGSVAVGKAVEDRAQQIESMGFSSYDALHIACAEKSGAEIFLTTDNRVLRRASRLSGRLQIRVANPFAWLPEVLEK